MRRVAYTIGMTVGLVAIMLAWPAMAQVPGKWMVCRILLQF